MEILRHFQALVLASELKSMELSLKHSHRLPAALPKQLSAINNYCITDMAYTVQRGDCVAHSLPYQRGTKKYPIR